MGAADSFNADGGRAMTTVAERTDYTPEDLLAMPDGERYELVNGALVERPMGTLADWVTGQLVRRLGDFCDSHPLGYVFPVSSGGFQGFPDSPRTVRKPDIAFVAYGRFPGEELPAGFASLAPDLAVEVISPNDLYEAVEQKIEEYVRAGVRLVWVISPQNRTVRVYRADGSSGSAREGGELDGEGVLPGFRCRVRDLFPRPPAAPPCAANGAPPPGS
jgi:Uma2 family endonuclease